MSRIASKISFAFSLSPALLKAFSGAKRLSECIDFRRASGSFEQANLTSVRSSQLPPIIARYTHISRPSPRRVYPRTYTHYSLRRESRRWCPQFLHLADCFNTPQPPFQHPRLGSASDPSRRAHSIRPLGRHWRTPSHRSTRILHIVACTAKSRRRARFCVFGFPRLRSTVNIIPLRIY